MLEQLHMRKWPGLEGKVLPWFLRQPREERPMLLLVARRGKGKTLRASQIGIERMREGYPVYANYDLQDPYSGLIAGRVWTWPQVFDLNGATVIIDEAQAWVHARAWEKTPPEVLEKFGQSRKDQTELIFTTQHEERVDKVVRQLVDFIVLLDRPGYTQGLLATAFPLFKRIPRFIEVWTHLESVEESRRAEQPDGMKGVTVPAYAFHGYMTEEKVLAAFGDHVADKRRRAPVIQDPDGTVRPWDRDEARMRGLVASFPAVLRHWLYDRAERFWAAQVDDSEALA